MLCASSTTTVTGWAFVDYTTLTQMWDTPFLIEGVELDDYEFASYGGNILYGDVAILIDISKNSRGSFKNI